MEYCEVRSSSFFQPDMTESRNTIKRNDIRSNALNLLSLINAGFLLRESFFANISRKSNEFGEKGTWLLGVRRQNETLLLFLNNFGASPKTFNNICQARSCKIEFKDASGSYNCRAK